MAKYSWKGVQGGKYAEGEISALNRDEAAYLLRQDKIIITSLDLTSGIEKKEEEKSSKKLKKIKKIPARDVIVFTKKLETMVRSGLPILETIAMLNEQTENPSLNFVVSQIYQDLESGTPLSDAFSKHPTVFDNVYINMLKAGESSGKIDLFMSRLVVGMEKAEKIKTDVKGALTYPVILLVVAIAVISVMMISVVPVFQDMFTTVEGGLPGATQFVVNISEFLRDPFQGGVFAGSLVGLFVLAKYSIQKNRGIRKKAHALLLKFPVLGELIRNSTLSKIAMIQGNLTAAGVPVLESIDIASSSTDNIIVQEAMTDVKRGVYSGAPLSELYQKHPRVFTPTFSAMVSVGERTGRMDEMFASISNYYEEETDASVRQLTSMLEPIMMVFLGGTIGFILIAMYTPMFSMGKAMGV
ncbi:MAG: hypothetical protein RL226_739 [Bacteroidota bacterium]